MKFKEIPLSIYYTLKLKALNASKLNKIRSENVPVIVSLTSIPSRLEMLHVTLRSILSQTKQPKKVILWLNENDEKYIPDSLKKLKGNIFEIRFSTLNCPHLKIVETLKMFPNDIIATCDDDFIYDKNWLTSLVESHQIFPKSIIAHWVRQIQVDSNGQLLPYKKWNLKDSSHKKSLLAIGAEGVLYPPKSLNKDTTDSTLFLKLAPKADDLWLKAMALLEGTEIEKSINPPKRLIPVFGTQKISLKKENVSNDKNVKQWQALTEYFKLDLK